MCLVINKCVTAVKVSNFSDHYLRNRSTLDIGVLGYIGVVQHKEHSPEVLSIPPYIYIYIYIYTHIFNDWRFSGCGGDYSSVGYYIVLLGNVLPTVVHRV